MERVYLLQNGASSSSACSSRDSAGVGFDPAAIDLWRRTLCLLSFRLPVPSPFRTVDYGDEKQYVVIEKWDLLLVNSRDTLNFPITNLISNVPNNFGMF